MSNLQIVYNELKKHKKITYENLFNLVKNDLKDIPDLNTFRQHFNSWRSSGAIANLDTVRGRFGGIIPQSNLSMDESKIVSLDLPPKRSAKPESNFESEIEDDEEDIVETGPTVYFTSKTRLHAVDKRNWAFQIKTGENWISRYYYPTLEVALDIVSRKLVDKELRKNTEVGIQAKNLAGMISNVQKNVLENLRKIVIEQEKQ